MAVQPLPLRLVDEPPRPVTLQELWLWLDVLIRFHGPDMLLVVEGSDLLMECRVGTHAGGHMIARLIGASAFHASKEG